ncbi:hypothetical protein L249_0409, partial [Ophiocordyceps polyrhachis-furcata BCC 54312]
MRGPSSLYHKRLGGCLMSVTERGNRGAAEKAGHTSSRNKASEATRLKLLTIVDDILPGIDRANLGGSQPGRRGFHIKYIDGRRTLLYTGCRLCLALEASLVDSYFYRHYNEAGIRYVAVPIKANDTPTVKQLDSIWEAYNKTRADGGTLIWCGRGRGCAGMALSALQIRAQGELPGSERKRLGAVHFKNNHVQSKGQLQRLSNYQRQVIPSQTTYRGSLLFTMNRLYHVSLFVTTSILVLSLLIFSSFPPSFITTTHDDLLKSERPQHVSERPRQVLLAEGGFHLNKRDVLSCSNPLPRRKNWPQELRRQMAKSKVYRSTAAYRRFIGKVGTRFSRSPVGRGASRLAKGIGFDGVMDSSNELIRLTPSGMNYGVFAMEHVKYKFHETIKEEAVELIRSRSDEYDDDFFTGFRQAAAPFVSTSLDGFIDSVQTKDTTIGDTPTTAEIHQVIDDIFDDEFQVTLAAFKRRDVEERIGIMEAALKASPGTDEEKSSRLKNFQDRKLNTLDKWERHVRRRKENADKRRGLPDRMKSLELHLFPHRLHARLVEHTQPNPHYVVAEVEDIPRHERSKYIPVLQANTALSSRRREFYDILIHLLRWEDLPEGAVDQVPQHGLAQPDMPDLVKSECVEWLKIRPQWLKDDVQDGKCRLVSVRIDFNLTDVIKWNSSPRDAGCKNIKVDHYACVSVPPEAVKPVYDEAKALKAVVDCTASQAEARSAEIAGGDVGCGNSTVYWDWDHAWLQRCEVDAVTGESLCGGYDSKALPEMLQRPAEESGILKYPSPGSDNITHGLLELQLFGPRRGRKGTFPPTTRPSEVKAWLYDDGNLTVHCGDCYEDTIHQLYDASCMPRSLTQVVGRKGTTMASTAFLILVRCRLKTSRPGFRLFDTRLWEFVPDGYSWLNLTASRVSGPLRAFTTNQRTKIRTPGLEFGQACEIRNSFLVTPSTVMQKSSSHHRHHHVHTACDGVHRAILDGRVVNDDDEHFSGTLLDASAIPPPERGKRTMWKTVAVDKQQGRVDRSRAEALHPARAKLDVAVISAGLHAALVRRGSDEAIVEPAEEQKNTAPGQTIRQTRAIIRLSFEPNNQQSVPIRQSAHFPEPQLFVIVNTYKPGINKNDTLELHIFQQPYASLAQKPEKKRKAPENAVALHGDLMTSKKGVQVPILAQTPCYGASMAVSCISTTPSTSPSSSGKPKRFLRRAKHGPNW